MVQSHSKYGYELGDLSMAMISIPGRSRNISLNCSITDKQGPHPADSSAIISTFFLGIMWSKHEEENDCTSVFTQQIYHQVMMYKRRDNCTFTFEDKHILYACILYNYFETYHRCFILHIKCLNQNRAHFYILCSMT